MRLLAPKTASLFLVCASLGAPAFAGLVEVKFDLADLNAADRSNLFEQASTLGAIEAQFEYCGLKTEIVPRATRAVAACVTTESLKQVIAKFRRSKLDMASELASDEADCAEEERVKWLRTMKSAIDRYIGRYRSSLVVASDIPGQHGANRCLRDVGADEGGADPVRQDEP